MRYLGTITGVSGGPFTNLVPASGSTGFAIPAGAKRLYLQPSASGAYFELGASGITTSDVRGAVLTAGINGPFRSTQTQSGTIVALYSANGAVNVRVYGSDV